MSYDDDDDYEDDREVKEGARVQKNEDVAEPMGGVLLSLEPAKRTKEREYWKFSKEEQDEMEPHWNVQWDDGSLEKIQAGDVTLEDLEVEREFRKTTHRVGAQIQAKLAIAAKALDEAEELSEEFGIPFSSGISPLSQSYYPTTTSELYKGLSSEFIDEIADVYHADYGEEGWQHSAVC